MAGGSRREATDEDASTFPAGASSRSRSEPPVSWISCAAVVPMTLAVIGPLARASLDEVGFAGSTHTEHVAARMNLRLGFRGLGLRSGVGPGLRSRSMHLLAGILLAVSAVLAVGGPCEAAGPRVDIRGTWDWLSVVGTARYPQTLTITSQDPTTGAIAGIDVGASGVRLTMRGTLTGTAFRMTIAGGGYTSTAIGTISGAFPELAFSGSFTDSNKARGTFTARLTVPAHPPSAAPAPSSLSATPAATAPAASSPPASAPGTPEQASSAPMATDDTPPSVSSPGNEPGSQAPGFDWSLPLEVGGVVALIAALGAAGAGMIPGVPGLGGRGGSATGSGSGNGSVTSGDATPGGAAPGGAAPGGAGPASDPIMTQVLDSIRNSPAKGSLDSMFSQADQQALSGQLLSPWGPDPVPGGAAPGGAALSGPDVPSAPDSGPSLGSGA